MKIAPVHLGAFQSESDISNLIRLLHTMDESCSAILFTSPQTIAGMHPKFIAPTKTIVKFIVIDKIHTRNSFGRSFRPEFKN